MSSTDWLLLIISCMLTIFITELIIDDDLLWRLLHMEITPHIRNYEMI